jgi:hypothetical protein
MSEPIQKREQNREGFLDAQKAIKRPFAMELHHRLDHGRISRHALVGDDMLTGIIALGRTIPEQQPKIQR